MPVTNVTSEVFGTVWKVEKALGDAVSAGEVILILESMKMEIPVEAPHDGTLTALEVAPEDTVEEDQVLCRIES